MNYIGNVSKNEMIKVLFVAYHGINESVMRSQGLPYIRELLKKDISYSILTFEKDDFYNKTEIDSYLGGANLYNLYTKKYHKHPRLLAKFFDIVSGIIKLFQIIKKDNIDIVHARGLVACCIALIPVKFMNKKIFFDTRGLLADKYVGGGLIKKDGILFKIMKMIEEYLLKTSDLFAVETLNHKDIISKSNPEVLSRIVVIPCCVDIKRFRFDDTTKDIEFLKKYGLENKFIFTYLGKIGTWYLFDEMLAFFKVLSMSFPNACFLILSQDDFSSSYKHLLSDDKIKIIKPLYEDIPKFLSCSDVGCFFINNYKRYNSSPIKFAEYLASGLPVVINSGIGDTADVTAQDKIGVVVTKFNEDEYIRKVEELKSLLTEVKELKTRCVNSAKNRLSLTYGSKVYLKAYYDMLSI